MIHSVSPIALVVFVVFVAATLGLSFYLGRRAGSAQGYFAAHGQIPWFINGVAFAGDYLSAASFLGICGMIAFSGYDGFLYSIGYLAGWIVALFVIAEPIKRRGKFTFADCLDSTFNSRGIRLAAGLSTLVVSIFYLIPQMVGAGVLIQPLLGLPHWAGVLIVGAVVILIVTTAGMVSTTWVQFLKGALLVLFSLLLTSAVLSRGISVSNRSSDGHDFLRVGPFTTEQIESRDWQVQLSDTEICSIDPNLLSLYRAKNLFPLRNAKGELRVFSLEKQSAGLFLREAQSVVVAADGKRLVNGLPPGREAGQGRLHPAGGVSRLPGDQAETGSLAPLEFLRVFSETEIIRWPNVTLTHPDGAKATIYYQQLTPGSELLRPGESPTFPGIRSEKLVDKLNFLSLMLALFFGTASLPHILIRYYTVKDEAAARKSTIVGIASIGCFYVLTLFMGLGAMTSGALDITDSNLAAPLLARSISETLFALISAIAFTTVLGTVSGLILASAGAVAHDLVGGWAGIVLNDREKIRVAKIASVVVGGLAILLGILFAKLNVNYLVGWAFSIAASANLPALTMLLFWKKTTRQGVIASVLVGMLSSLTWILLSSDTYSKVYGLPADQALAPFSQPGIVTIPLAFLTLIVVSWLTAERQPTPPSSATP
jgi:cation/acetate symporter